MVPVLSVTGFLVMANIILFLICTNIRKIIKRVIVWTEINWVNFSNVLLRIEIHFVQNIVKNVIYVKKMHEVFVEPQNRTFICSLLKQYYHNKQKHQKFCFCFYWQSLNNLLDEMDRWSFYDLNRFHDKWFIIFHKSRRKITLFPVFM